MAVKNLGYESIRTHLYTNLSTRRHLVVFVVVWGIAFTLPWLGMTMVIATDDPIGWRVVHRAWIALLPYFAVSLINEFGLIPFFYAKRKYVLYTLGLILMLTGFVIYQNCVYNAVQRFISDTIGNQETLSVVRPTSVIRVVHINIPVLSRLSIALLVVGCGLAYNVVNSYKEAIRLNNEKERQRLLVEVEGLKAQMSPHFFMNMLNNIHGAMEKDVAKAEDMLLKLSKMMRYVTYDTVHDFVNIKSEVEFLRNYLNLMTFRYPEDKVKVEAHFPSDSEMKGIHVAPMVFINFVENAFKHGVSYKQLSKIIVKLKVVESRKIVFECFNTFFENKTAPLNKANGIGIANVRRRLDVLYENRYKLITEEDRLNKLYKVILEITVT